MRRDALLGFWERTTCGLMVATVFSVGLLASINIHAEQIVENGGNGASSSVNATDNIDIIVPASCTLTTGGGTYARTIMPGSNAEIAANSITTFCNDVNGYAIYAVGYSNDSYDSDSTGSNTDMIANLGSSYNITSGSNNSYGSNWQMKLTAGTDANVVSDFANYHAIPASFTKVADYESATTAGTITPTYKVSVAASQPNGTYVGKVKYVLVHPNVAPAPVGTKQVNVTYDGNGETFAGGANTNAVSYNLNPMYIANTPQIVKSPNVSDGGTKQSGYVSDTTVMVPVTASGASRMKVVVDYGMSVGAGLTILPGELSGEALPSTAEFVAEGYENVSGTASFTFEGDTVTIYMMSWESPTVGYDYGFYAQVYPIYVTEQNDTSLSDEQVYVTVAEGTYATTSNWYGSWYLNDSGNYHHFSNESEVISFLNKRTMADSQDITLERALSFDEALAGAGKTKDGGYYVQQDINEAICNPIAVSQNQPLKDIRDDTIYMVGKLKDGKCWMLDNMALDLTDANVLANVTEQNTHASATSLNYLKNGGGTQYDKYAITGVVEWSESPYYYNNDSFSDPLVATGGDCYDSVNCANDPAVGKWTKDSLPPNQNGQPTHYGVGSGKIGIYYNYCAVSAGSYCYGNGDVVSGGPFGDALEDICPKNWRMPTGHFLQGEFKDAIAAYNSNLDASSADSFQYNFSVTLSGEYSYYGHPKFALVADGQGFGGEFWSSTGDGDIYSDQVSYYLEIFSNSFGDSFVPRTDGRSLRCLVGN